MPTLHSSYTGWQNSPNYVVIGGGAYQPGSAAAKLAQQLYNAAQRQAQPTTNTPQQLLAPYAPPTTQTAPVSFPSYSTGGMSSFTPGSPNLAGAGGMRGKGAFGLVPQVPNPISTSGGAIGGNLGNLGALTNLGTGTTKLAANLGAMPFNMNLPGYGGMLGQASEGIMSNLQGIIDPSEWNEMQSKLAERGTRVGISPSSPNFDTALMQALDKSIIDRQALGQQQLNAAIGRTPTGQQFNIAGQQISPADLQSAQYAANVASAAPDPTMAAEANLDMLLKAIEAGRAGGAQGGGGGYGGGGIPRLGGTILSPVSAGYPGFNMPGYSMPQFGSGWSGVTKMPVTTAPGQNIEDNPYPWSGISNVDVNSGENVPSDIYNLAAPLMNDFQYWPEGLSDSEIPQYWPEGYE